MGPLSFAAALFALHLVGFDAVGRVTADRVGTGVLVGRGIVLTSAHLFDWPARSGVHTFAAGPRLSLRCRLTHVRRLPDRDLALATVGCARLRGLAPMPIARDPLAQVGEMQLVALSAHVDAGWTLGVQSCRYALAGAQAVSGCEAASMSSGGPWVVHGAKGPAVFAIQRGVVLSEQDGLLSARSGYALGEVVTSGLGLLDAGTTRPDGLHRAPGAPPSRLDAG